MYDYDRRFCVENGMVVGAQREWELMYAETPWEHRRDDYVLDFVDAVDLAQEVIASDLAAEPECIDAVAALHLFSALPKKLRVQMAEDYIVSHHLQRDYDRFITGEE